MESNRQVQSFQLLLSIMKSMSRKQTAAPFTAFAMYSCAQNLLPL